MRHTNLTDESEEYLARREELRLAEIEEMRQRERVAELRRHLPQGPVVQDYVFQEGPSGLDAGMSRSPACASASCSPVRTARSSSII
jgi:predicted dithiol-disulfide oxidoreductase (DUF899 family)